MKNRILFRLLLPALMLGIVSLYAQKQLTPAAEDMKNIVLKLTSEEMGGRLTGEQGNYKAADYIAEQFRLRNVQPLNGKYLSDFTYNAGVKLNPKNAMQFNTLIEKPGLPKEMWMKAVKKWNISEDWLPVKFSDNGTVTGDVVFAGYGISAKDIDYDDYAGIDVKGKIVIVLSDSAENAPKESRFANYSELRYKAMNAREHGAIGIIFVKMLSDSANTFYPLKGEANIGSGGIIAVQANRTKIATFFPRSSSLYPAELEMKKTKAPKSFILPNTTATITVDLGASYIQVPNVTAIVKGTEKPDEYIVVGAHFDHLGYGTEKSKYRGKVAKLHPGADDNASGVAAMLEAASKIAASPLKRSVVFVAFNGEEEGLLGSANFIKNNSLPEGSIVSMVNLDMVGRMKDNKLNVFGTGTSPIFDALVDDIAAKDTVSVIKVEEGYSPSDHSSFYSAKIPVPFLFTGVHLDYHTPADEADKLNYNGMDKVSRFLELLVADLANATAKPPFKQAEKSEGVMPPQQERGYGAVWFGIVPDFEPSQDGFKIQGTSPGSPAEKAGLKGGDILKSIGDKSIKNIKDLTFILREHKPGDKVAVSFLREGKEKSVDVTLVKR